MLSTLPRYEPFRIKKKRAKLLGELLPYKKISASSKLEVSDLAELKSLIPMDATPLHSLQLPARSFFKALKKKKQVLFSTSKSAIVLSVNTENSRDFDESPSCK